MNYRTNERRLVIGAAIAICATMAGCSADESSADVTMRDLPSPTTAPPATYLLEPSPWGTRLTWTEEGEGGSTLLSAAFDGDRWGEPVHVGSGEDWFVNWADRPSVVSLPGGAMMAHWLVNSPGHAATDYTYGIAVAHSDDEGASWKRVHAAGVANDDPNEYTGFLDFWATEREVIAAYLAAPEGMPHPEGDALEHVMTLRLATFSADGSLLDDSELDADVCSCCPLSLAETSEGPVLVYRDRRPGEVRDISIVRRVDGAWTDPAPVHEDGWVFAGCPTNGPVVAAEGDAVAVAWFTGATGEAEVRFAMSDDAGATFGNAQLLSLGRPIGYTGIAMLDDGDAVVSWLEAGEEGGATLMLRRVSRTGVPGPAVVAVTTNDGRPGGMPQLARMGDELLLAWEAGGELRSALVSAPPRG